MGATESSVSRSTLVDASPERVWAVLAEFEQISAWAADVDHSSFVTDQVEGVGTARRVQVGRTVLIERVTAMQDHLGLMNDADITASMTRTFLVEHAGELSPLESAAIGRYLVDREREVARLRRSIGMSWRGVAGARFKRGLGRVVADL